MFSDIFRRAVNQFGGRVAIRHDSRTLTYAQLWERSCRLANVLGSAGVAPGAVVCSLGRNRLESLEEITAGALGGHIRSPLYWQDTPERQVFMIKRVKASALIVDEEAWPPLKAALAQEQVKLKLVVVRDGSYEEALARSSPEDPCMRTDYDATYIIRFSAGTTGLPKPVAHSERGYHMANQELTLFGPGLDSSDVYLAVSPYSHGSGNLVWPCISYGAGHVVMQGFDADRALELIEQEKCTTLFLVPTMIQRLLSSPKCAQTDLSSIRRVIYGAAPIPPEMIKSAIAVFGDTLFQTYGQSEIVPLTVLTPSDHRADLNGRTGRLRSAGRPTPSAFVRIEDDAGNVLPRGEIGEIVGSSPGAMIGIFGDEQATADRFTRDGWIRTNDMGWMDEEGYLFVTDRKDDMIISGGFNIAPAEVEAALVAHPDVIEAVVFGAPHASWGSTPVAVVRLVQLSPLTESELISWCQQRIGSLKKPSRVIFSDEPLPISSAGKLLRRVAKANFLERV